MSAARKISPEETSVIEEVCALVESKTGVQLGRKQFDMAESRLRRRIADLGLGGFAEYRAWLTQNKAQETEALVSLLTTHHTYFFREFSQFELLEKHLPRLAAQAKARGEPLSLWSAACSRGQEVYSLAMHLHRHLPTSGGGDFKIFGTDVDPESVKIASNGVYLRDEIKEVPMTYLGDHWAKGTGEITAYVKAKKTLRTHCEFAVGNLMGPANLAGRKFDVIFCRNVFIYFTVEQVKAVTRELLSHLHPGGFLAIGLSESLHGMSLPVKNIGPSIYGRKEDSTEKESKVAVPSPGPARALKVVCIDDSPVVLSLLKKILSIGLEFEVVGTAGNGEEGAEVVKRLQPDLVTLDIHMPVCSGLDYLKRFHGKNSPPVIMVTSVSRDDADLAREAIRQGASDFVEKPALNNLKEKGEELRAKLKAAFAARGEKLSLVKVDKQFASKVSAGDPDGKARLLVLDEKNLDRGLPLLRELNATPISFTVVIREKGPLVEKVRAKIYSALGRRDLQVGTAEEVFAALSLRSWKKISLLCLGDFPAGLSGLRAEKGVQLLLEDGVNPPSNWGRELIDSLPSTSFVYTSDRFLGEGG